MSTAGSIVSIAARTSSQLPADVWLAAIALAAVLLAGAVIIAWVSRWRRRLEHDTLSTHDQLTTFRLLYERGELSQDEYQRVRQQLLTRLKAETAAPTTGAAPTAGDAPSANADLQAEAAPPAGDAQTREAPPNAEAPSAMEATPASPAAEVAEESNPTPDSPSSPLN
ncbi:MAG: hypothetical protein N2039_13830 [Gemmataceae bacterium]|nr:hypothetical protein [Gemmataceae bacterium]